ncbi:MAG: fumarylacetoacetate hydrolase family protein [Myxococcota bacterium]
MSQAPDLAAMAARLDDAAMAANAVAQLSAEAQITVPQAYEVQALNVGRRLSRGERLVGIKMGFTSRAKMIQMGLSDLIWGRLTSGMRLEDGGVVDFARYVHPRIEPEVAFLLGAPLQGEVSPAEAGAAVEAVAPAMELIDSRYRDFKFSLPDVIADNASSSGFVVGAWRDPAIDLATLGMVMEVDGVPAQIGSSAAILGHPLRSLAAASRVVAGAGMRLEPGMIVLAGGATAAVALKAGQHVRMVAQGLGQVQVTVR